MGWRKVAYGRSGVAVQQTGDQRVHLVRVRDWRHVSGPGRASPRSHRANCLAHPVVDQQLGACLQVVPLHRRDRGGDNDGDADVRRVDWGRPFSNWKAVGSNSTADATRCDQARATASASSAP